ncbi:MAG: hypothetical protein KGH63_01855 [Candidatus Micrarchaeota archaeon]|nr:hypothetical protein [Candidatus Micrarchaeota archaeon]
MSLSITPSGEFAAARRRAAKGPAARLLSARDAVRLASRYFERGVLDEPRLAKILRRREQYRSAGAYDRAKMLSAARRNVQEVLQAHASYCEGRIQARLSEISSLEKAGTFAWDFPPLVGADSPALLREAEDYSNFLPRLSQVLTRQERLTLRAEKDRLEFQAFRQRAATSVFETAVKSARGAPVIGALVLAIDALFAAAAASEARLGGATLAIGMVFAQVVLAAQVYLRHSSRGPIRLLAARLEAAIARGLDFEQAKPDAPPINGVPR